MNHSIVGRIVVVVVLLVLACHDSVDKKLENESVHHVLNETVGAPIPLAVAEAWVENYNKKYRAEGRENAAPYYAIDAANFNNLLNSDPDLVGMVFHYAIDDKGETHIIVIPLDRTRNLWPTPPRTMIDANTNAKIENNLARKWTTTYRNKYPADVRSHFFGINIFKEIQSTPGFSTLEMRPGLKEDNTPQLLLYVWRNGGMYNGKTKDGGPPGVYDAGDPCPPFC